MNHCKPDLGIQNRPLHRKSAKVVLVCTRKNARKEKPRRSGAVHYQTLWRFFQLRPRLPLIPTLLKLRLGLLQGRHAHDLVLLLAIVNACKMIGE